MSRRGDLDRHRARLSEVRDIMNAMRTLAFLETRKLGRSQPAQQQLVSDLQRIAAEFSAYYPATAPVAGGGTQVLLLVGSERGFCGDFNRALAAQLLQSGPQPAPGARVIIAVGRKLHSTLPDELAGARLLVGAGVAEEVAPALQRIVAELAAIEPVHGMLELRVLYHVDERQLRWSRLLPMSDPARPVPVTGTRPLLQLPPERFLLEFGEQYLLAALQGVLLSSLMAESQHRILHLDAAIRHLDRSFATLQKRLNAMRQEEIIEEIEVILLSAAGLAPAAGSAG